MNHFVARGGHTKVCNEMITFLSLVLYWFIWNLSAQRYKLTVVGHRDNLKSYPYVALVIFHHKNSINSNEEQWSVCSAFVIGEQWLLTAANCVARSPSWSGAKAILGKSDDDENGDIFDVESYLIHENYPERPPPTIAANDICLLKTTQLIQFTEKIQPIALPVPCEVPEYFQILYIVGHNYSHEEVPSQSLNAVEMLPDEFNKCDEFEILESDPAIHFCTRSADHTLHVPCLSDRGSAVVAERDDDSLVVLGVVGGNNKCYKSINIRLTAYLNWIQEAFKKLS